MASTAGPSIPEVYSPEGVSWRLVKSAGSAAAAKASKAVRTTSDTSTVCSLPHETRACPGFASSCASRASPTCGGEGLGVGVPGCGNDCASSPPPPPPPPLPQPAAGLPASGNFKRGQTPAGRGLVGGGSTPSVLRH